MCGVFMLITAIPVNNGNAEKPQPSAQSTQTDATEPNTWKYQNLTANASISPNFRDIPVMKDHTIMWGNI